mmetsp:Transcript_96003/g.190291  ORF Transcript_96003/g.190291 Transcript_96003/m.190291 type:complete len:104 (+) Transcript_96003:384-695(+)
MPATLMQSVSMPFSVCIWFLLWKTAFVAMVMQVLSLQESERGVPEAEEAFACRTTNPNKYRAPINFMFASSDNNGCNAGDNQPSCSCLEKGCIQKCGGSLLAD